jgi:hypothetical protein
MYKSNLTSFSTFQSISYNTFEWVDCFEKCSLWIVKKENLKKKNKITQKPINFNNQTQFSLWKNLISFRSNFCRRHLKSWRFFSTHFFPCDAPNDGVGFTFLPIQHPIHSSMGPIRAERRWGQREEKKHKISTLIRMDGEVENRNGNININRTPKENNVVRNAIFWQVNCKMPS